jgi:hypothetical protein
MVLTARRAPVRALIHGNVEQRGGSVNHAPRPTACKRMSARMAARKRAIRGANAPPNGRAPTQEANGSVFVKGIGRGSCPRSVLGVTSGAGGGATGATGFGRAIGLFGAAGFATAFAGAAFLRATFFAFFAFFATAFFATFALPAFFDGRAFFLATLFLAAERFVFAAGRFFPLALAFFFAMVGHLLAGLMAARESSPEKVCCHLRLMLESMMGIA